MSRRFWNWGAALAASIFTAAVIASPILIELGGVG
ncbi:hypothetical protein SEA_MAGRITTE_162 [Microbacterium phage Magritte]|nr:hypothetical protein SEA_MAGRITTE_162 [Microbacterium phage Magritte]